MDRNIVFVNDMHFKNKKMGNEFRQRVKNIDVVEWIDGCFP